MALESNLNTRTYEAAADLSAKQYHFVESDTSDQVNACDAAGEQADGVLQNDPDASGKAATVAVGGRSKVEAGEAISVGDDISTAADGQARTAVTGDVILGTARSAASNAGEIISVELTIPFRGTA